MNPARKWLRNAVGLSAAAIYGLHELYALQRSRFPRVYAQSHDKHAG
jgi:hypothetical protein